MRRDNYMTSINHRNGNIFDNSPENIEIVAAADHQQPRKPGRPRIIDPATVKRLRESPERFTWKEIADRLQVSESSVIRVYRPFRRKA